MLPSMPQILQKLYDARSTLDRNFVIAPLFMISFWQNWAHFKALDKSNNLAPCAGLSELKWTHNIAIFFIYLLYPILPN